ncbi:MAG TPA: hypothetical protein VM345_13510 [Acidimicrobiales bacterium]|nr:hypothetical protein [Acidimicrobiales bacterium]
MSARRIGAGLAAAGLATLLTAAPAVAAESQVTIIPAEPGTADAVALEVGPIKIGRALAKAGPTGTASDSEATGNAIEINGNPPAAQFGGSQKGKGKKTGELAKLSRDGAGSIRVAPWEAEVADRQGGGTRSSSSAALVEIIGQGLLRVDVARGEANAEHDGKDSKGWAQSDGARVFAGPANQLQLIVLHAESRSDNTGETYLVGINGTKIGTNSQISQCPLPLPQQLAVARVNCVAATGGAGAAVRSVTAGVVDLDVVPINQGVAASSTSGRSASGSSTAVAAPAPEPAAAPAPAELPATAPDDGGFLPRTGPAGMGLLAAAGAAVATLGGVILALGRRFSLDGASAA